MARKLSQKAIKAAIDNRISVACAKHCSNIQIDMMDIAKVFALGQKLVAEGVTDQELGDKIAAYVETIRKN